MEIEEDFRHFSATYRKSNISRTACLCAVRLFLGIFSIFCTGQKVAVQQRKLRHTA